MKFLIFSDIHGCSDSAEFIVGKTEEEKPDKVLILGDILYHGPRNDIPHNYEPKAVIAELEKIAPMILAVRGNCEAEVDQMVLPFNVSSDYAQILADGLNIHLSHGHRAEPPLKAGDVYLTGHTHVQLNRVESGGYIHLNPGSVSLPKENGRHGYIVYENRTFTFKDFDGNQFDERKL